MTNQSIKLQEAILKAFIKYDSYWEVSEFVIERGRTIGYNATDVLKIRINGIETFTIDMKYD